MRRPGKSALLVALCAVLCLLLAGCGAVTTLIDTSQALRDAGYQSVSVSFRLGSGDEVDVSVKVAAPATLTDADDVAHVVWNKFHERFQSLHVTVQGTAGTTVERLYAYSDLVSMFGARNPAWDRTTISSATTRLGAYVIVGLVVAGGVVAVVAVVATRRSRRRRNGGPGGYPGGPGGYPGAPAYTGAPAYPGDAGGRWQPGVGWQPNGGRTPQPKGDWRPAGGSPAPDPLWPPPDGPPPGRAPAGGWGPAPPPPES